MAVLKNKTQGNYTIVSQNIMRDKNLSLTERGMLLTLLSLPDNWHLTIMGLCQILPDGKDKIGLLSAGQCILFFHASLRLYPR
ncbi:MAG: hypothetical protein K5770_03815 [Lachnospiraceae bacterium]|nr:hypothetical protein [Lachnospiraceae bacterium]